MIQAKRLNFEQIKKNKQNLQKRVVYTMQLLKIERISDII